MRQNNILSPLHKIYKHQTWPSSDYGEVLPQTKLSDLWLHSHFISHDKLETLYLVFRKNYDQ